MEGTFLRSPGLCELSHLSDVIPPPHYGYGAASLKKGASLRRQDYIGCTLSRNEIRLLFIVK